MTGRLFIDNKDVFKEYGLYVPEQGYNNLIQWASLKPVPYNDWYEEDGIDPDLSNPILDSRHCTLRLVGESSASQIDALKKLLNNKSLHKIEAWEIKHTSEGLRYVSTSEPKLVENLWHIDITFIEDNPTRYDITAPSSQIPLDTGYIIDGRVTTDYGVRILEGTLASLSQMPSRKENWVYSSKYTSGSASGDADNGHLKDYVATLRCLMRAETLDELWNNYYSLYGLFTQAGTHDIRTKNNNMRYPCYYLSQQVRRFYATDKIWLEFDIELNIYTTPTHF